MAAVGKQRAFNLRSESKSKKEIAAIKQSACHLRSRKKSRFVKAMKNNGYFLDGNFLYLFCSFHFHLNNECFPLFSKSTAPENSPGRIFKELAPKQKAVKELAKF